MDCNLRWSQTDLWLKHLQSWGCKGGFSFWFHLPFGAMLVSMFLSHSHLVPGSLPLHQVQGPGKSSPDSWMGIIWGHMSGGWLEKTPWWYWTIAGSFSSRPQKLWSSFWVCLQNYPIGCHFRSGFYNQIAGVEGRGLIFSQSTSSFLATKANRIDRS